jgi:hypothetical protein
MLKVLQVTTLVMASLGFGIAYVQAGTRSVVQSVSVIVQVAPLTNPQEATVNALIRAEDWDDCQVYSVYHGRCNWKSL